MNKRYKYIFLTVLFLLVGFLHIYPDVRFIHELGKDFKGVSFMGAADETVYLSRIAGVVYRGDIRLANVGTYGHQGDAVYFPFLSEVIEGTLGKLFGLEVWQIDIWATFLLTALVAFLIYLLAANLSGSSWAGVLASLGVMFGYYWFTPNLKAIFNLSADYLSLSLFFVRPISPQFQFIPLLLAIFFIYNADTRDSYKTSIAAGIMAGSLFFTGFYSWTFVYSGLGVLIIIALLRRKILKLRMYSLILLIVLIFGSIYWRCISFPLTKIVHLPEIFARSGIIYTHAPIIPVIDLVCFVFLILLSFLLKERKEELYYMISFVFGGIICLNQQIVTGKTIQPSHWQSITNKIFIIICLFVCGYFLFTRIKKVRYIIKFLNSAVMGLIFFIICAGFITMGFIQQNLYYAARSGTYRRLQSVGPALNYIHRAIPAGSVILTDPVKLEEERLVSVLTKNFPYISSSFFITSVISLREIEERFLFALHFFGYSVSEAQGLFCYMDGGLFRGMQVHPLYGGTPQKNKAYINYLKNRFIQLAAQDPIVNIRRYKVDYVLIKKEDQSRLLSNSAIKESLHLDYSDDVYALYKLKDYE